MDVPQKSQMSQDDVENKRIDAISSRSWSVNLNTTPDGTYLIIGMTYGVVHCSGISLEARSSGNSCITFK